MMQQKKHQSKSMVAKTIRVAMLTGALSAIAGLAYAGGYYSNQGYYYANCGTFFNACNDYGSQAPLARYLAGSISYNEYSNQRVANQNACMSAKSACEANPKTSPSSPSGKIFEFRAVLPY